MRLASSSTRKLAVFGIVATAAATLAAMQPAAAQYYPACPAGYYLSPGYGCVPYAYAPGYAYAPDPAFAFGFVGGGWGWGHGWAHGGWGHGGGFHGGGHR